MAMDTVLGNRSNSGGQNNSGTSTAVAADAPVNAPQTISAYQNYDFKPGQNIIFYDNFADDQDGEFPAHWDLKSGQGVVNSVNGQPTFLLTNGNYAIVAPLMSSKNYLTDTVTVEFDYLAGSYEPLVRFLDANNNTYDVHFDHSVSTSYFPNNLSGSDVGTSEQYNNHWHHAALIFMHGQLKCYLNNTRALVMPHTGVVPTSLEIGGLAGSDAPLTFRNFRIAEGGYSNTIGNLLTNGKFITHDITFEVGKATIRPESMGVLNDVVTYLKHHPDTRFEIDGYTDNDGSDASNISLSQQRAEAVRTQLTTMGVNGSRLMAKGLGEANPIAPNTTPEGKATNRRVEFVKM